MKRRGKGEGSIQQRGNGTWRIVLELPKGPDGKRRQKYVTVRGSKADAHRKLRELHHQQDNGISIDSEKLSVAQFLDQWLRDYAIPNTSLKTARDYDGVLQRYVRPMVGNIRLDKLTPSHIQAIQASILEKGLSARTAQLTHRVLSMALKHAVRWGLLSRNVCNAVDPPRIRQKEMRVLDAAGVQRFLESTRQSPYGPIFYLAIYSGMRRGELVGIQWQDIDLRRRTLAINRTVSRITNQGLVIGKPKTAHSLRVISLPQSAVTLLAGLRAKKREYLERVGLDWDDSAFVFCHANGGPMCPDTLGHAFQKALKRAGLPHLRFHDLRHTHATLMLKEGVNPKIVSERLGHASIHITLQIYGHVMPGMQEAAVDVFESTLDRAKVGNSVQ